MKDKYNDEFQRHDDDNYDEESDDSSENVGINAQRIDQAIEEYFKIKKMLTDIMLEIGQEANIFFEHNRNCSATWLLNLGFWFPEMSKEMLQRCQQLAKYVDLETYPLLGALDFDTLEALILLSRPLMVGECLKQHGIDSSLTDEYEEDNFRETVKFFVHRMRDPRARVVIGTKKVNDSDEPIITIFEKTDE